MRNIKKYLWSILALWVILLFSGCLQSERVTQVPQKENTAKEVKSAPERNWNLSDQKIEVSIDTDGAIEKVEYFMPSKIIIETNKITVAEIEKAYGKKYMNYSVRLSARVDGVDLEEINRDKTKFFHSFGSSETNIRDSVLAYDFKGVFKEDQKYFTLNNENSRIYITFAPFTLTSFQGEDERKIKLRVVLNDGSQRDLDFFLPKI